MDGCQSVEKVILNNQYSKLLYSLRFTEWKFSSLRYVNRKNFRFTEWKPEIFPVYEMETGNFTVSIP